MVLNAGRLNRKIQIQRYAETGDDGIRPTGDWSDLGAPISASRRDVSDQERLAAAAWDNVLVARFTVRASAFGRSIRRSDRLMHDGVIWEIDGIKEVPGAGAFLEITAVTGDHL